MPSFGAFLSASAASPHNSGPGFDNIPAEVWAQAPMELKAAVNEAFLFRISGLQQLPPAAWRLIVLFGLPKEKEVSYWQDFRWISCCPSLQKGFYA